MKNDYGPTLILAFVVYLSYKLGVIIPALIGCGSAFAVTLINTLQDIEHHLERLRFGIERDRFEQKDK